MNRQLLISMSLTLSIISCTALSMQGKRSHEEAFHNDPFEELCTLDDLDAFTPAVKTPRTGVDPLGDIEIWEQVDLGLGMQGINAATLTTSAVSVSENTNTCNPALSYNAWRTSSADGEQENAPLYPSQNTYVSSQEMNTRNEAVEQNEEEPIECAGIYNMQKSNYVQSAEFKPLLGAFQTLPARSTFVWCSQQTAPGNSASRNTLKFSNDPKEKIRPKTRQQCIEKWTHENNIKSIMRCGNISNIEALIENNQSYPQMFVDLLNRSVALAIQSLKKIAKKFKQKNNANSDAMQYVCAAIRTFIENNKAAIDSMPDTGCKKMEKIKTAQNNAEFILTVLTSSKVPDTSAPAVENQ